MPRQQSIALLEVMIVLIIIGIVSALGLVGWQGMLEREYADNAQITLKLLKDAEQAFFTWKGCYTSVWNLLDIDNPEDLDKFYDYNIEAPAGPTGQTLSIKATRKGQGTGFTINQDGTIVPF